MCPNSVPDTLSTPYLPESQSVSQLSGGGSPGDDGVFTVVIEGVCLRRVSEKGTGLVKKGHH
jgi:hypothetical protein